MCWPWFCLLGKLTNQFCDFGEVNLLDFPILTVKSSEKRGSFISSFPVCNQPPPFSLALLHWLGLPIQCWEGGAWVDIFFFVPSVRGRLFSLSPLSLMVAAVSSRCHWSVWVNWLPFLFAEGFFMNGYWILWNSFFWISWFDHVLFLHVVDYTAQTASKYWILHIWAYPHLVLVYFFIFCIWFAKMLLKIFASIMRNIGL